MLDDFGGIMRWDNIQQWIDSRGDIPGHGPITGVQQMQGGSQNLLFLLERGEEKMVLRRPPQHLRDNSNKTMVREATVLAALVGSDVPHAELFGLCDDAEVTGACFYLMEPLEGYSPKGPLPGRYAENPEWRRAMGEQLVRASAALASVDHVAAGLSDFGKPDDWHARQIERWRSQLEGYRSYRGYDTGELGRVDAIGRWLGDNLPNERRIGIIHGDYQWPNVMFSLDAPIINGLIDWELSTLGDPMLDLGWMLTSWIEPGDPEGRAPMVTPWQGFMTRRDLITLYCELTQRNAADVPWFFTLACYKLACILEGSYARSLAGQASVETGLRLHGVANWLFTKAERLIGES